MRQIKFHTVLLITLFCTAICNAQVITLQRPGERDFIVDNAELITPEHEQQIRQLCDRLLTDTASPIIVVTIESMRQYTQRNFTIESFARTLFDQWGIGHLTINNQPSNTGILFLVSRDDRKVRIELGIGWDYEKEAATQQIMNSIVVPQFRSGDFSTGILQGVQTLEQMVRQGPGAVSGSSAPPGAARSTGAPRVDGGGSPGADRGSLIGCGGFGLIILIAVIFFIVRALGGLLGGTGSSARYRRRYRRGPGFGTGMLGGLLLGHMLGGRRSSGSSWSGGGFGGGGFGGGGFGGGSFGGGFSGGRGASGSW